MQLLTDDDVRGRLTPALAVSVARRCLIDAYQDVLLAPPRLRADLGAVDLVFTVGGYLDGPVGFRAYGTWPQETDQAVVVWGPDGSLLRAACSAASLARSGRGRSAEPRWTPSPARTP